MCVSVHRHADDQTQYLSFYVAYWSLCML